MDLSERIVLSSSDCYFCYIAFAFHVIAATVGLAAVRLAFEVTGLYDLFSRQLRRSPTLGSVVVWVFTASEILWTCTALAVALAAFRYLVPVMLGVWVLVLRIGTRTSDKVGVRTGRLAILNLFAYFPMHSPTGNVSVETAQDRASWGAEAVALAKRLGVYTRRRKKPRGMNERLNATIPSATEGRKYVRIPVGAAPQTRGGVARQKKRAVQLAKQREKEARAKAKKEKGKKVVVAAHNPVEAAELDRVDMLAESAKRASTPTKQKTEALSTNLMATSPGDKKLGRAREQWGMVMPDSSAFLNRRRHWNLLFILRCVLYLLLSVLPMIPILQLPFFLINSPIIVGICNSWAMLCQSFAVGGHPQDGDGFTLSILLQLFIAGVLHGTLFVVLDKAFFKPVSPRALLRPFTTSAYPCLPLGILGPLQAGIELHSALRAPTVVAPSTVRVILARYPTAIREVDEVHGLAGCSTTPLL